MSQNAITSQTMLPPVENGESGTRRRVVLTVCLLALALLACRDAWMDILQIVRKDDEASHIMLVPIVFARLVWVRRDGLKDWRASASLWGVAIAFCGVGLWLFGNIKAMQILWHLGAVITLVGAFVAVNGLDIVRRLWPAFLVLFFLMPLPGTIRHPLALFLQNASAQATEIVIVALGFELVRHGNLLVINDYSVGIAEACNGMRMVSMLILIVFAFVFSEHVRPWVRIFLILSAVPIAIFCNIVRLVPTVLAYGYFSPAFADQMHDWLGWVLVFASYFVLMGLLWLMRWLLLPVDPDKKFKTTWSVRRRRAKPFWQRSDDAVPKRSRALLVGVGIVVVLGVSLGLGFAMPDGANADGYHADVRDVAEELPRQIGPWSAVDTELPEAAVALLKPNVLISRRYENEETGQSFAMLVVQCADARDMEGHYPPNCYPSSGWSTLGRQSITLDIGSHQAASMDYRFERKSNQSVEQIGVVNLILVPGDGFVTSMRRIRQLAGTISDRFYGAAQVQFVFSGQWEQEERQAVVEQVGASFEPLMDVILDKTGKNEGPGNNR